MENILITGAAGFMELIYLEKLLNQK